MLTEVLLARENMRRLSAVDLLSCGACPSVVVGLLDGCDALGGSGTGRA